MKRFYPLKALCRPGVLVCLLQLAATAGAQTIIIAFLLGAATPGTDARGLLPTISENGSGNLVLNFDCLPVAARGDSILKVSHITNLTDWTPIADVVPDSTDSVPDNNVTFVVGEGPAGPPALMSVTATIDAAAAAGGGKLFGRIEAFE